jgi:hypothetical protein
MTPRDALQTINQLAGGYLIERLAEALVEVSAEVAQIGQPGAVTLKLAIKRVGDGTPEVVIEETISRTAPKRKPRGAILWAVDGGLHQDDPRQSRMDLAVDRPLRPRDPPR